MNNLMHAMQKNFKQFTYLCLVLFFLMSSWVYSADDLDKKFKEFTKDTKKIREQLNSLPAGTSPESKIIDAAIKEIDEAMAFVGESFRNEDIEITAMTLTHINKSLSDISKLVPKEVTSDMSGADMSAMPKEKLEKMMQITKHMQVNKKEKLSTLVEEMTEVEKSGLNLFQVSYNLNDLGVETLKVEEIAKAVSEDPALKDEVVTAIKKGMKDSGVSAKKISQIDSKMELPDLTTAKMAATTTGKSDEIEKAREVMAKAEETQKAAKAAKTAADDAKKVADDASAKAKQAVTDAENLFGQKSDEYETAIKSAKEAKDAADAAIDIANNATQDYQDAIDVAAEAQKLADAAGVEWVPGESLKEKFDRNKGDVKGLDDYSRENFNKESELAVRLGTDVYDGKDQATTAASDTWQFVYDTASGQGLSPERANILADNAKSEYLDMHFEYVQSEQDLLDQNLSAEDAKKFAKQIVSDKYGEWSDRLWSPGGELNVKQNELTTWISGVKTLTAFHVDPDNIDINEKKYSRIIGAVRSTWGQMGVATRSAGIDPLSRSKLAENAKKIVRSAMFLANSSYEDFMDQGGYTEEEAKELAKKVVDERYGDWLDKFFSDAGREHAYCLTACGGADTNQFKLFAISHKSMEWALGDLKAGVSSGHEAGKYQADIEAAEQETYEWLSTRAEALGMPEEDARNFAENASQQVKEFYYYASAVAAFQSRGPGSVENCDEACWEIRDEQFEKIMGMEVYKDSNFFLFNAGHNFDITEGGTLLPDEEAMNIYVTGIVVTDASQVLQAAADAAKKAEEEAKKLSKELEDKQKEADRLLEIADQYEGKTSDEAKKAKADAEEAVRLAKLALTNAKTATNLSDEAQQSLKEAQDEYTRLKGILDNLTEERGLVYYPEGQKKKYSKDWKGKPSLVGIESLAEQEAAKPERIMAMGTISGNPKLTAALNGMTDAAVYKLIESGALPSNMVEEYMAGDKVIVPTEFIEAERMMQIGEITDNPVLAEAMNGMSDSDVHNLLESGILSSDMVAEYIQDGKNAPILPCGSSTCEMVPGAYYNGVLYSPNTIPDASDIEQAAAGAASEMSGAASEVSGLASEIAEATSGIAEATSEISEATSEMAAEVQAMAESLGIAEATAAAAAAAGVDVSEQMPTLDAMQDPNFDAEAHNRAMQEKAAQGN